MPTQQMTLKQQPLLTDLLRETADRSCDQEEIKKEFKGHQFSLDQPKIDLSESVLLILCPLLIVGHLFIMQASGVPPVQFGFVTMLVAFLLNYTLVLRKYHLLPYLPDQSKDTVLKVACITGFIGLCLGLAWGFNGSAGVFIALVCSGLQRLRSDKLGLLLGLLVATGCSTIRLNNNANANYFDVSMGLLSGLLISMACLLGSAHLKKSSTYAISNQFMMICAVVPPIAFPASPTIVPSVIQLIVMLVCGGSVLITVVLTVKLLQVSSKPYLPVILISGALAIAASGYSNALDIVSVSVVSLAIVLLAFKQHVF